MDYFRYILDLFMLLLMKVINLVSNTEDKSIGRQLGTTSIKTYAIVANVMLVTSWFKYVFVWNR